MKNKLIILFAFIMFVTGLCLNSCCKDKIYINKEESFYSDFKVLDGKVYVYCSLVIENSTGIEKNVSIKAFLKNDAKNGLLKEEIIEGFSIEENTKIFRLQKDINRIDVVFIGDFAGEYKKYDRTLPNITIEVME